MGANDQAALTEAVYYILLSLVDPMHGYGIMQHVKDLSHGRVNLGPGTLYGALNTLVEKGWIASAPATTVAGESDTRKKAYVITSTGKDVVSQEIARLQELIENGNRILQANREREWGEAQ